MTIEEKAKAYDEAIEALRSLFAEQAIKHCDRVNIKDITNIFSELKESEDERVRKNIIIALMSQQDNLIDFYKTHNTNEKELIAWLEKQGEQRPSEDEDREYACQSSEHYTRRELMIYNLGIADGKRMVEDAIKEAEQNPTWSEEDEKYLDAIEKLIIGSRHTGYNGVSRKDAVDWLKSLKGRVQPKQEWSKEDESHIRYLIECLEHCKKGVALTMTTSTSQEYIDWLKSLRPQSTWKPSEEQMASITCAVRKMKESACYDSELVSFYNDLKKLREE